MQEEGGKGREVACKRKERRGGSVQEEGGKGR